MYTSGIVSKLEIGFRCNMLTVISEEVPGSKTSPANYLCRCDCGEITTKRRSDLVSGRLKSCGCVLKRNMIGLKFNKLTILSVDRVDTYIDSSGRNQRVKYFNCLCACGNETTIRQSVIRKVKSCGCQQTIANKLRTEDISGQSFGRLTADYRDNETGKWVCSCSCGGTSLTKLSGLRNGDSQSCGCLQREKASISISNQHREKRRSKGLPEDIPMQTEYAKERLEFKPLSSEIMKRDLYTCAWCSQKSGSLNVHHLETWMNSPELRFTKSNLVTLCVSCHKKVHIEGNTKPTDPIMTILLQGYANEVEDGYYDKCVRVELTPDAPSS